LDWVKLSELTPWLSLGLATDRAASLRGSSRGLILDI
jgi:hypothetical protein